MGTRINSDVNLPTWRNAIGHNTCEPVASAKHSSPHWNRSRCTLNRPLFSSKAKESKVEIFDFLDSLSRSLSQSETLSFGEEKNKINKKKK